MDETIFQLMAKLIAPAAMISACGVLTIASSTRHGAILAWIHELHREKIELLERAEHGRPLGAVERYRLEGIELLSHRMLRRAWFNRSGLIGILVCVGLMICSSLSLASIEATLLPASVAITCFVLGACALLVGTVLHILEIALSLDEARLEHARVEALGHPSPATEAADD